MGADRKVMIGVVTIFSVGMIVSAVFSEWNSGLLLIGILFFMICLRLVGLEMQFDKSEKLFH